MSIYGPVVTSWDVEQAVRDTLRTWFDTYLGEVERQSSGRWARRAIKRPASWTAAVSDYHADTADRHLPAIIVESSDVTLEPAEDGRVDARVAMNVLALNKGKGRELTRELLAAYEAAIIRIFWHQGDLGGISAGVFVGTSRSDAVASQKSKTLAGLQVPIIVVVPDFGNRFGGPAVPDPAPPTPLPATSPDDPAHATTNVTVEED